MMLKRRASKRILLPTITACFSMLFVLSVAQADSIPMTDYIFLSHGMTEAEVLYRVGPPDHETIASDHFNHILNKTWYYIPGGSEVSNRGWITEITFSGNGKIRSLNRFKP